MFDLGWLPVESVPIWLAWLSLFVAAFVSASLIPASSEVVFLMVLFRYPEWAMVSWLIATIGNTLGGLTSYGLGRLLRQPQLPTHIWLRRLQKHGAVLLVLSWMPVLGDGLCVAAGWLRLQWQSTVVYIALGKALRYAVLWFGLVTFSS